MKKSSRVISTLLLGATVASTTTGVFAAESNKVIKEKLAGENRFETAIAVSEQFGKADTVVLVNYTGIADALAATPLAKMKNAPILLTEAGKLTKATADQIEKLGAKNVIVIGGENAVSTNVVKELETAKLTVERLAGEDRYSTSEAVAKEMGKVEKVAVVNGVKGLADALSVAAPAAKEGMAIILSNGQEINAGKEVVDGATTKYVVGGEAVVSEDLAKEMKAERLSGANRNATNAAVLNEFYTAKELDKVYVAKDGAAKANELVDALAAGPLAGKEANPVMLVGSSLDKAQEAYLKERTAKTLVEVGNGVNANSVDAIVKTLEVKEAAAEVTKMSAKIVADNKVVVTFDAPVEDANHTNFGINGGLAITEAKLSQDKKSVELTTNVSFTDGRDYEVVATGLKNADGKEVKELKANFKYEIGKYQAPVLTKTEFEQGENIKDFVVVKDANGLAISGDKFDVTGIQCDVANVIDTTTGKVTATKATAAQVRVSVTMYTGDVVEGTPVTIKVTVPSANAGFVSAAFNKVENATEAERSKMDTTLAKGSEDKLYVYTKDSKGNPEDNYLNLAESSKEYVVKNNAPTIADFKVINSDGTMQVEGLRKGKASFTITNKDGFKQTVEFNVTEANTDYKDLALSATSAQLVKANVLTGSTIEEEVNQKTIKLDWVDQDDTVNVIDLTGADATLAPSAKATLTKKDVAETGDKVVISTQSEAITLEGSAAGIVVTTKEDVKPQNAKITVSYFAKDAKTAKTVKTINIAIKEAGDHAKYIVEQVGALDAANAVTQSVAFKTFSVDANGVKRDDVTDNTTFALKQPLSANVDHWINLDATTKEVKFDAANNAEDLLNYDGEVTLTYTVGADAISEHVVKFTNSKNTQKSVQVKANPVSIKLDGLDTVSVDDVLFGKANTSEVLVDAETNKLFGVRVGQDGYKYNAPLVSVIGEDGKAMASGVKAYGIELAGTNGFEYGFKDLGKLNAEYRIVNKSNLVETGEELSVGNNGASATFTIVIDTVTVDGDTRLASADKDLNAEANLLANPVTIDVTLTKALSDADKAKVAAQNKLADAKEKQVTATKKLEIAETERKAIDTATKTAAEADLAKAEADLAKAEADLAAAADDTAKAAAQNEIDAVKGKIKAAQDTIDAEDAKITAADKKVADAKAAKAVADQAVIDAEKELAALN